MDGAWWDKAFAATGPTVVGWSVWKTPAEFRRGTETLMETLLPRFDRFIWKRPDVLIDFGCGWGRLAPYWTRRTNAYVGIDVSSDMILHGRALYHEEHDITFYTAEEFLPLDGIDHREGVGIAHQYKADVAVTVTVLQHCVGDLERKQALKRLTFCNPVQLFLFEQSDEHKTGLHCRKVTLDELRRELPGYEWCKDYSEAGCDGREHSIFLGERPTP